MGAEHRAYCCRNRHSERHRANIIHACAAWPGSYCRIAFNFIGLSSAKLEAQIAADRPGCVDCRIDFADDRTDIVGRLVGNAFSGTGYGS